MARPGWAICGSQPFAHEFHQAALRAALDALQPRERPMTIKAIKAAVFAKVKIFCTSFPNSSPRVLLQVRSKITTATNCSVERLIA